MSGPRFTAHGKQVMFAGSHYADACDETAAAAIVTALNAGWQPIETAPRDGTPIDIWRGGEFPARVTNVEWREPTDSEWWVHGGDTIETPDPTWHDMFGPLGKDEQPTHWMARPDAPVLA